MYITGRKLIEECKTTKALFRFDPFGTGVATESKYSVFQYNTITLQDLSPGGDDSLGNEGYHFNEVILGILGIAECRKVQEI